jgi:dTDP-glucose 4,6-dehydratase
MQILVTGGMGFIGSHLINFLLENLPEVKILNLDILTYAANPRNHNYARNVFNDRYEFVHGDIGEKGLVARLLQETQIIFNLAAETHVDRSLQEAGAFIRTNVQGVNTLLQAARDIWGNDQSRRFIQVSSDEVYGSVGNGHSSKESDHLNPRSPYSASKAAADLLALSYYHAFGVPVIITRASNNYGPCQFPEKFIPLVITNALERKKIPVYGHGRNVRDWLFVNDHCQALYQVSQQGRVGEIYNVSGQTPLTNLQVIDKLFDAISSQTDIDKKTLESLVTHVADRPGHDQRYALDCGKIKNEIGFSPQMDFGSGIDSTVRWYLNYSDWWQKDVNEGQLWIRR